VTVLPRTRAEDREFRAQLRRVSVRWRQILEQPNARRPRDPPEVYETTAEGPQVTKEGYRLIWIRSSQKAGQDAEARTRALHAAEAELVALGARLNRGRWRRRCAIRQAARTILKRHRVEPLVRTALHAETRVRVGHLRRGRPRAGDPVREERRAWYRLEFAPDIRQPSLGSVRNVGSEESQELVRGRSTPDVVPRRWCRSYSRSGS